MTYCINPNCKLPENEDDAETCNACASRLVLRGRYRAVKVLGQGGFGKTYKAIDEDRLGADCVIKQFMPQVQGVGALEKAAELFNQEAIRLYELGSHSQIPTLLAYFIHQNNQYLVQEFVPGVDLLKELETEGRFSEEKIWTILFDLLPILQFVHEHQVIHRDLKPENLIRRESDRRLVLIDFGGAKQIKSVSSSITGTTIGSQGFIPIEILTEGQVFPSSDLYSLGVTCFNLLTQISPDKLFIKYGFSWIGKWRKALKSPISDGLAHVLGKFLQENLEDRYQSAAEALEDAQRWRNTPAIALVKNPAKNQISAPTIPSSTSTKDDEFNALIKETFTTRPSNNLAKTLEISTQEDILRENDFDEDDDLNQLIREAVKSGAIPRNLGVSESTLLNRQKDNDDEEIKDLLKGIRSYPTIAVETDISIQEWECAKVIESYLDGVSHLEFCKDSQVVITAGIQNTVSTWNISTGAIIKTLIDKETCALCSGLGQINRQVKTNRGLITSQVVKCSECEGFGTNSDKGIRFSDIAINPVNRNILLSSLECGIKLFSDNGKFLRSLDSQLNSQLMGMNVLAISLDGQTLAASGSDRNIKIWDLEKNKLIGILSGHQGLILDLIFGYNNQTLISSSADKTIKIWNTKTGKLLRTLIGHSKAVSTLALSSDGQKLASGSYDTSVKIWEWKSGYMTFDLVGHSSEVTTLACSSNSSLLVSGASDGSINIWDLEQGKLICILVEHGDRVEALAFAADGKSFVSGSRDRTMRIWEQVC